MNTENEKPTSSASLPAHVGFERKSDYDGSLVIYRHDGGTSTEIRIDSGHALSLIKNSHEFVINSSACKKDLKYHDYLEMCKKLQS